MSNKHSIAIASATVGVGIVMFTGTLDTMPLLGGAAAGLFIGYFIAGLAGAKQTMLQKGFGKLGNLKGKSLNEIVATVGPYKEMSSVNISNMDNAPGFLYTWAEGNYLITLLFDANNNCICVNKELLAEE